MLESVKFFSAKIVMFMFLKKLAMAMAIFLFWQNALKVQQITVTMAAMCLIAG